MNTPLPKVVLADNQDITAAGIRFYLQGNIPEALFLQAINKKELISQLLEEEIALVVLDYALFDFSSVDEVIILHNRFPKVHFLLFSEALTDEFVKKITCNRSSFSVLLKDCDQEEVHECIANILDGKPFLCSRIAHQLTAKKVPEPFDDKKLTNTEREVLKLIASGKSTKEIAAERFLSIHTVITHRKNIFRKLEVNNLHEETKYALRAGFVYASEFYI
jgi:DNA-binding NarL/FixJ family response regulator